MLAVLCPLFCVQPSVEGGVASEGAQYSAMHAPRVSQRARSRVMLTKPAWGCPISVLQEVGT